MCKVLAKNTDEDLKNNLVAVRHDESHLNKYIYMNTNYRLLNPSYLYPEG
ncbi:MAG: hypothetical protein LBU27_01340 [Candidatus Peribacteria bacterium]|nr:hypothetical protein [Candidatus Peribacteria bacterium]